MHDETVDEPGKAVEHVVEREEGVRNRDALRRGVRDVALVPERDVLESDHRRRADDPGQAADPLGGDRVPLVRHRRGALLPGAERFLDLPDLGAREMTDLDSELLERNEIDDRNLVGLSGVVKISHSVVHGSSLLTLDAFAPVRDWEELSAGIENEISGKRAAS